MTLFFTLAFMVLVFWRPQEWLLPWLYGWPLLDAIVYTSLLTLVLEVDTGRARFPRTPAVYLAVGLWLATIASHVPHTYFGGIVFTVPDSFKLCFFMVLMLVVIDREDRARLVVITFVLATCVMAAHALMQKYTGRGFGGQAPLWAFRPKTGEWQARSLFFGIFGDPNDLAQILATSIPLAFAMPRRMTPIGVIVAAAAAGVLYMGLMATHSRGGMVALAASVGAMVFLVLPVRALPYAAAIGLIGGLLLCAFGSQTLLDISAQERVVFWGMGNRAFKANPIFGLGYGMFWQVTSGSRAAHNAFVCCYTEVGILGYWFWFSLLQLGIIGCYRTRMAFRRPKNGREAYMRRLAGLGIAALSGFAAGGYFLSRSWVFPFFFLFGLLNAVPLIARRMLPDKSPPLIQVRRDVFGWGTVSTLASIVYIYVSILLLNRSFYG
jgi:hypothetical protein